MNNLIQTYISTPILREDQDYNHIEKTILSVLVEQKVSFKQTKEIFDAIETKIKNKLVEELAVPDSVMEKPEKPVMSDMDRLIYKLDQIKVRLEDLAPPDGGRRYTEYNVM